MTFRPRSASLDYTESNTRAHPVPAHVRQGEVSLRLPLPPHWRQAPAGWATRTLPFPPQTMQETT